jgi:hypothetical protein
MSTPAKVDVGDDTRDILGALALGDPDLLAAGLVALGLSLPDGM